MMAQFWHPETGYFETITAPTPEQVAAYPAGTIAVPARPGPHWKWDGAAWIEGEKPAAQDPVLSPARFAWMLAYTGLEDVWAALENVTRDSDRAAYAALRAHKQAASFGLAATLDQVARFRPVAEQIAPDIDLSETTIRAAWHMAAGAKI